MEYIKTYVAIIFTNTIYKLLLLIIYLIFDIGDSYNDIYIYVIIGILVEICGICIGIAAYRVIRSKQEHCK